MTDWQVELAHAIEGYYGVARCEGWALDDGELTIEFLERPHRPPSRLPIGKMALYAFYGEGCWLKIGIVGPNSHARYSSQHYNAGSAQSTLAASLMRDPSLSDRSGIGTRDWICQNCHRANVLVNAQWGKAMLVHLEAYVHFRLKPRYEGGTRAAL